MQSCMNPCKQHVPLTLQPQEILFATVAKTLALMLPTLPDHFSSQREPPKRYQRFGHLGASPSTTLGRSAHYTCGRGRHMDRHRHLQLGCSGIILKWFDLSDPYCTYWSPDFRIVNFSVFFFLLSVWITDERVWKMLPVFWNQILDDGLLDLRLCQLMGS